MYNTNQLPDVDLPDALSIHFIERNVYGETNDVFLCRGEFDGRMITVYIKVNKDPQLNLSNEQAILNELKHTDVPVPEVLWYGGEKNEVLIVDAMKGDMIWDYIDPRRRLYDRDQALLHLHAYGDCLAQIHGLDIVWPPQKRSQLHGLIGEESVDDDRFRHLVSWLNANNTISPGQVFVHGDFNTANVLFENNSLSGVVDWELAGSGWREYDLARALRARLQFQNTEAEREAILNGYKQSSFYDEKALQWCEVINYLHFAYWSKENVPDYASFSLDRAFESTERI